MEEKRRRQARAAAERCEEERRLLELLRRAEEAEAESLPRRRCLQLQQQQEQEQQQGEETNPAPPAPAATETGAAKALEGSVEANSKLFLHPGDTDADVAGAAALFPPIHPAALSIPSPSTGPAAAAAGVVTGGRGSKSSNSSSSIRGEEGGLLEELMTVGMSAAVPIPIPTPRRAGVFNIEQEREGPFEGSLASESTLLYLSSEEKARFDAQLREDQAYWRQRLDGGGGFKPGSSTGSCGGSRGPAVAAAAATVLSPAAQLLVQEADELLERAGAATATATGGGFREEDGKPSPFELSGLSLGSLPDLLRRLGTAAPDQQERPEGEGSPLRDISNRPAAAAGKEVGSSKATAALAALLQADRDGGRQETRYA